MKYAVVNEVHVDGVAYYYNTYFSHWRKAKAYLRGVKARGWDGTISYRKK